MGQVSPLPQPRDGGHRHLARFLPPAPPVRIISTARCALCGARLEEGAERSHH